jgi:lysophospholipase L1-like esterase
MKMIYSLFLFLSLSFSLFSQEPDPTRFAEEIQPFMEEDPGPYYGSIVFAGSSSFRMWEGMEEAFPDKRVLNRGFGGSHMSDLYYYREELILKYRPEQVLIYEGDNDIDYGKSPREIMRDTRQLVESLREEMPGLPIAFVSPKPSILRWPLRKSYHKLNRKLAKYCQKTEGLEFIDVWSPVVRNGELDKSIFIEDGLHLNEKGYQIWKEKIGPVLIEKTKD